MFKYPEGSFEKRVENLKKFLSSDDPYEQLMILGKNSPFHFKGPYQEKQQVSGCQSEVWLIAEKKEDKIHYLAHSSSYLVHSLVQALCYIYSSEKIENLLKMDWTLDVFPQNLLSANRIFGLQSMKKKMLLEGLKYADKT